MSELKELLEYRLKELKALSHLECKEINEDSLKTLVKNLALGSEILPLAKEFFSLAPRLNVIWLHLAECTGCSESLLRTQSPDLAEFIFDFFSLNYHETLMSASGTVAEELLEKALEQDFVLCVEGGVAAIDTFFLSIGAKGESGYELLRKVSEKAKAIFAVGTCSSYGGIQAAFPNPTKTCGIAEVLTQKVIQIPGCPPSDVNIVSTLAFYALFERPPELDDKNRPKWAYGKCLHDMCERKIKFESGIFAKSFDDEAIKNGACLFKVGCKGPYTYNNCPKVKFNAKTSWPIQAGHGCMACSEEDFWDAFGFYEKPMNNIFAYAKFSHTQNAFLENKNSFDDATIHLNDDELLLHFGKQTQIFFKENDIICNFLELEFESNLKLALNHLSQNKIGVILLENYKKEFAYNYAFIEENFDDLSRPCGDIWKFFELSYILAKGQFLKDKRAFLRAGESYVFKHISPYDFKLNINEKSAKLELNKSLRMSLIYLCGGLDFEGIAFSLLSVFGEKMRTIFHHFHNKRLVLGIDESLNCGFLHKILS